jgi:hypothetical protein
MGVLTTPFLMFYVTVGFCNLGQEGRRDLNCSKKRPQLPHLCQTNEATSYDLKSMVFELFEMILVQNDFTKNPV